MTPRSYLFVPAHRPERYAKACASGAHAVIVDLEDAVPPTEKETARAALAQWLSPAQPVVVRVNAMETPWYRDDIAMCRTPGVAGVVVPKCERASDLAEVAAALKGATPILPLVESAQGLWNAFDIARCACVERLLFGSIDFQLDLGIGGDDEELVHARSQIVLVSRVARLQRPVDGVTTALDDPEQLRRETLRARRYGFGAKLCIHPKQVGVVNECFAPTPDEIAWANRVVEAASRAAGGAVAVDGKMVDRPVILQAEDILRDAEMLRTIVPPAG
ncbi:MAG TPA: CoA ester lyase [Casimicrobiaceae bacterium]|nr:CoA ester lyase [Casimicrobiaceae bacterium]